MAGRSKLTSAKCSAHAACACHRRALLAWLGPHATAETSWQMDTVNVPTVSWPAEGTQYDHGSSKEHTSALGRAHEPSQRAHGACGTTSLH
eukprot:6185745-Pleurochrysis_carterae.AAC.1